VKEAGVATVGAANDAATGTAAKRSAKVRAKRFIHGSGSERLMMPSWRR